MVRLELATLGYKPSALAIELTTSKAIAGKELSLSSWCIASLYIYHFLTVVDFSFEKYTVVLLDTGTPGTSREIYSEDATSLTIGILTVEIFLLITASS